MTASSKVGTKRRWLAAMVISAVFVGGVLALFRAPAPVPEAPKPGLTAKPPIRLSPGRAGELALRDLAPLFLPTPVNAPPAELRPREPGRDLFDRDAERWRFSGSSPSIALPATVELPADPADALSSDPAPLALTMGRAETQLTPVPRSGGHVDVFAGSDRNSVFSISLDPAIRPKAVGRDSLGWQPLEFAASVDAAGLVGTLSLTRGSGVDEIDEFFRNYLARTFRIGDRLAPGFYRIVVGP